MKLLLFSDLHLDSSFAWMGSSGAAASRRRQALCDTLEKIVTLAEQVKADAILCGGDLYEHERVSPDTASFLRSVFARLDPIPVYIAPGNHDWFGPQSLYGYVDWSPNVHVFRSGRLEPVDLDDGVTLWGAAHLAPANTDNFLRGFRVDRAGVNVALFHGSERTWLTEEGSGKAAHAQFEAEEITEAGLQHAFLGHYHTPRDAPTYTYPGNPDPLSFGETGERGVVIATLKPNGAVGRVRMKVGVTEAHDLDVDVTGCSSLQAVRSRISDGLRGLRGVARVRLQGELDANVSVQTADLNVESGLDSVLIEPSDLRIAYELDKLAEEQTVRGEFVRMVLKDGPPQEKTRKILLTGLRALDARDDLEVI